MKPNRRKLIYLINCTIKYKELVATAAIIIIFLAGTGAFLFYFSYLNEIVHSQVIAKNNSTVLDQNIQVVFSKIDLSLVSAAKFASLSLSPNKPVLAPILSTMDFYKAKVSEVHAFRFADKDGMVVVNTDRSVPTNVSIKDREYFQYHEKNANSELYISKPMQSKFDGKMIITLSRRITA